MRIFIGYSFFNAQKGEFLILIFAKAKMRIFIDYFSLKKRGKLEFQILIFANAKMRIFIDYFSFITCTRK